jgi:hypothetical protein
MFLPYCREDYFSRTASDNGDQFSGYDLRANETVTREGEGEYSAELFSRKAVEVIEAHNPSHPLFLYLAFQNIHKERKTWTCSNSAVFKAGTFHHRSAALNFL